MAEATADATKAEGQDAPRKSKKLLWIVVAAAVLGIGAAAVWFFALRGSGAEAVATGEQVETEPQVSAGLVTMDTFLVNLNTPSGDRYMKLTMRFSVAPESVAGSLGQDDLMRARLRDRVLTILTSKTFEDISDPLGKENLRLEIRAQLNPLITDGEVQDVLFSEFVVQ